MCVPILVRMCVFVCHGSMDICCLSVGSSSSLESRHFEIKLMTWPLVVVTTIFVGFFSLTLSNTTSEAFRLKQSKENVFIV